MSDMSACTVADVIGEDYKGWKDKESVFISAPTGSGKTYFVLNTLLPYFSKAHKKILYLVNRQILKKQIEDEVDNLPIEQRESIKVVSYQSIERDILLTEKDSLKEDKLPLDFGYQRLKKILEYQCVVCDECHYFLADSNYNTNTALSFRFIQDNYMNKMRIFMSATIEQIQDYILKDSRKRWKGDADYYGYYHISNDYAGYNEEYTEHIYSLQRQYNYIDVSIIRKDEEIEKLIDNKQGKWLIFVDNIQKGKKLEETLKKHKSEDEVVFIFSGYEDEVESEKQVREIINNKKQSAQILISTSVMDNGITLKDIELRNIILMADTEVEFIQMLGRKRQDGKKVQVYIYVYDKNHFVQRRQELKEKRKICVDYRTDFIQIIKEPFDSGIPRLQEFHVNNFDWENYNKCEKRLIEEQHVQVMRKIDDGIYRYGDVKSLFNVYGGTLYLNSLAMKNIENLQAYYSEIIKKFENDETNAFIREQLCWLGKEDEEVDKIIEGEIKEFYKEVKMKIDARLNKPMLKQEMNDFHKEIRIKLLEILKHECWKIGKNAKEDYETAYNTLYRSTSCISKKTMSVLSEICDLPYEIDVIQRSKDNQETTYTFRRILNEKK